MKLLIVLMGLSLLAGCACFPHCGPDLSYDPAYGPQYGYRAPYYPATAPSGPGSGALGVMQGYMAGQGIAPLPPLAPIPSMATPYQPPVTCYSTTDGYGDVTTTCQ